MVAPEVPLQDSQLDARLTARVLGYSLHKIARRNTRPQKDGSYCVRNPVRKSNA
jgi:hypothetical protein